MATTEDVEFAQFRLSMLQESVETGRAHAAYRRVDTPRFTFFSRDERPLISILPSGEQRFDVYHVIKCSLASRNGH